MYVVLFKSTNNIYLETFKTEDEAVGFAIRKKGYVLEGKDPIKEIKEES